MSVPIQIRDWLRATYPSPQISPEWLDACYEWITTELAVSSADTEELKKQINAQLLQSDLADSTVSGTGLPLVDASAPAIRIPGPVLCQITALSEVGNSAFSLMNVRQNRIDKADMTGLALAQGDHEAAEDEGPVPKYPRSMMRVQLSDGSISIGAFEYRKIPQLDLADTPLGFKLLLRNAMVRAGYVFLEPACVTLLGYGVDELDQHRDRDFLRGLKRRLGHDDAEIAEGELTAPLAPDVPAPEQVELPAQPDFPPPPAPDLTRHLEPLQSQHAPPRSPIQLPLSPVSAQAHFPMIKSKAPKSAATTDDWTADAFDYDDIDDDVLAQLEAVEEKARADKAKERARQAGTQAKREEDKDGDVDMGLDDINDDVLAQLDAFEATLKKSEPQAAAERFNNSGPKSSVPPSSAAAQDDIIAIVDSDDDKENVKSPPRRAKPTRKPPVKSSQRSPDSDVIEISD